MLSPPVASLDRAVKINQSINKYSVNMAFSLQDIVHTMKSKVPKRNAWLASCGGFFKGGLISVGREIIRIP